jgi:hypothetical protein
MFRVEEETKQEARRNILSVDSTPALGLTQPFIHCAPGAISAGMKRTFYQGMQYNGLHLHDQA